MTSARARLSHPSRGQRALHRTPPRGIRSASMGRRADEDLPFNSTEIVSTSSSRSTHQSADPGQGPRTGAVPTAFPARRRRIARTSIDAIEVSTFEREPASRPDRKPPIHQLSHLFTNVHASTSDGPSNPCCLPVFAVNFVPPCVEYWAGDRDRRSAMEEIRVGKGRGGNHCASRHSVSDPASRSAAL